MNQIYLGQRVYGFSSATQIYGKELKDITAVSGRVSVHYAIRLYNQ